MVFESQSLVELVAAHVHVVGFQMHCTNSLFATACDGKDDGRPSDSSRSMFGQDVELIDQTIATLKFEGEPETEDHIAKKDATSLEKNKTSESRILDQLQNEPALSSLFVWQSLENVEVTHKRQEPLDIRRFGKPK